MPSPQPIAKEVVWWIVPDFWVTLTQRFDFSYVNPIGQLSDDLRVLCSHIRFVASPIHAIAL